MISLEDIEDLSALTRAEIDALAEHEHLTTYNATLLGEYLMHMHHGPQKVHQMLCEDIRTALHKDDLDHAKELFAVLRGFLAEHPEAARGALDQNSCTHPDKPSHPGDHTMGKRPKAIAKNSIGLPPMAAAMMAVNPIVAKAWLDLMSEGARFAGERMGRDMELGKAMLACKDPSELMQVQAEFFNTALAQYLEESARYSQMSVAAWKSIVDEMRAAHTSEYNNIPL